MPRFNREKLPINVGDRVEFDSNGKVDTTGVVYAIGDDGLISCILSYAPPFEFIVFYEDDKFVEMGWEVDTSQQDAIFITTENPGGYRSAEVNIKLTSQQEYQIENIIDNTEYAHKIEAIIDGDDMKSKEELMGDRMGRRRRRSARTESKDHMKKVKSMVRNIATRDYAIAELNLREALDRKAHKAIMQREQVIAEAIFGGASQSRKKS